MPIDERIWRPTMFSSKLFPPQGWRISIFCAIIGSFAVLVANIILLAWCYSKYPHSQKGGVVTLFEGSCARARSIFTWSHFPINIRSTCLLAASNVGMQCDLAPTHRDLKQVHAKEGWMHIGILSIRNAFRVSRTRRVLATLLALSSHCVWPCRLARE